MKKILLLLTVLVLALSVTACNKATGNDNDSSKDNKRTESSNDNRDDKDDDDEKNNDDSKGTTTEEVTEEPTTVPEGYSVSEEILNAPKFEQVIQIGNTVLQIPFTFQDILDAGATIKTSGYTPDYIMAAGDSIYVDFTFDDGTLSTMFCNDSDSMCSLKDLEAVFSVGTTSSNVFLPGGIHIGTTLSELQETWGAADVEASGDPYLSFTYYEYPSEVSYVGSQPYTKSLTGNYYIISVDRNTAEVKNIGMAFNPRTDEIVEHAYGFGTFDFVLPMPACAEYGLAPNYTSTATIDGVDYIINFPMQLWDEFCDYSPTEEALNSALTASEYTSIKDPIEQTCILRNDEELGIICAFYTSSKTGRYTCRAYALDRTNEKSFRFEFDIYAYNGEATSDNAKEYFVNLMKELVSGCYYKAN